MIVYRIAQQSFINNLSGRGAYLYGGRWSLKGTHAVYAASTRSLAYLEYLVHQFERDTWPNDLFISDLEILNPSAILTLDPLDLPGNWTDLKYHGETQLVATTHFMAGIFGVQVPSVIIPEESNVILNPQHPEFESWVRIRKTGLIDLDKRFGR